MLECYHQLKSFARTGQWGRPRPPVKEVHPDLVYAQLVKKKEQGRLKELTQRTLCHFVPLCAGRRDSNNWA